MRFLTFATILVYFFRCSPMMAQDTAPILKLIQKVHDNMISTEVQVMKISSAQYDLKGALIPESMASMKLLRSGDNFRYELTDRLMVYTKKHGLVVDHADKQMVVFQAGQSPKHSMEKQLTHWQTYLDVLDKIDTLVSDSHTLRLRFHFPEELPHSMMDIEIDLDLLMVREQVVFPRTEEGTSILKSVITMELLQEAIPTDAFELSKYFKVEKNVYKAQPSFKNYHLIQA